MHILAIGQSNLANHCGSPASSDFGQVVWQGLKLPIEDPIKGGSGAMGSVWPRLAGLLSAADQIVSLKLTLTAQGGTSIQEWAPGGPCFDRLLARIEAGDTRGVTHVIFQQGEKDTLLNTDESTYVDHFRKLHATLTEIIGTVPWIICQASYRSGITSKAVLSAQLTLASMLPNAILGPNLDRIGEECRRDNTHFNDMGLDKFAKGISAILLSKNKNSDEICVTAP